MITGSFSAFSWFGGGKVIYLITPGRISFFHKCSSLKKKKKPRPCISISYLCPGQKHYVRRIPSMERPPGCGWPVHWHSIKSYQLQPPSHSDASVRACGGVSYWSAGWWGVKPWGVMHNRLLLTPSRPNGRLSMQIIFAFVGILGGRPEACLHFLFYPKTNLQKLKGPPLGRGFESNRPDGRPEPFQGQFLQSLPLELFSKHRRG